MKYTFTVHGDLVHTFEVEAKDRPTAIKFARERMKLLEKIIRDCRKLGLSKEQTISILGITIKKD